jgi:hypothetical protein
MDASTMVFRACALLLGRETDVGEDGGVSATASCQLPSLPPGSRQVYLRVAIRSTN